MNPIPFLRELAANNNRVWFKAHKSEYDDIRAGWIADIDRFIKASTEWTNCYAHLDGKSCTYRVYRDTRFSLDKTPYKTNISSYLSPGGKTLQLAGFYITAGVTAEDCGLFGGIWRPEREKLRKLRRAIVYNIEEFRGIINDPDVVRLFPDWYGEALKTAPQGWDKNHPDIDLLRLIDYGRMYQTDEKFYDDAEWPERAAEILRVLQPLNDFLNYSLIEEEF